MRSISSKWSSLWIVSTAVFLSVIDIFIVNVAIPSIQTGIDGSDGDVQLVIALYLLGYAAFLITGGKAGDFLGRKKVFITGTLLFTLSSVLCGFSQTASQLIISRLVQGISAAFMVPQSVAYIQVLFPGHKERVKALGIYGSIAGSASVIGQLLGGILPDTTFISEGWRLIFLINLPIGLVSAILAYRYLPEQKSQKAAKFDFTGVMLLSLTLICHIFPVIQGRELGWPAWSVALLALSFVLFILLILHQKLKTKRNEEPLISLKLFSYKDFNLGLCASLFYFMVQDTYFLINTILLQSGFAVSSSKTGVFFVFQGLGYVLASVMAIRFIPRFGKLVLIAGVFVMIFSLILHIIAFNNSSTNHYLILSILFLYGMGCGSVLPSLLTFTLKSIPPKLAGAASGTYATFQQTAIALGIGIIGGVFFSLSGKADHSVYYFTAYRTATIINIFLLLLVAMSLYLLPDKSSDIFEKERPDTYLKHNISNT
ncbi:MFS transporter [Dyadobacter diqingensis]|uniref:MFS transporter n=1 Tax=Dyadobacter diqingensis TaxID=2938121 RepID=UPI0020C2B6A7|nr:MFS transporter [Dyadobacter diqingensis]